MMKESIASENSEIRNYAAENLEKFKSDGGTTISEAKSYADSVFLDIDEEFYTDYADRYNQTPKDGAFGSWSGERGESKYIPSGETDKGKAGIDKLAEYGMDGIEYRDCEPNYSNCSEGTVQIDDMSENRPSNFAQADEKLAEQWKNDGKEGKNDWTAEDIDNWRHEHNLSWHECCDTKTMNLLSRDIHGAETSVFIHSGGVAECKARDNVGDEFDE